jgi:two-component system NarL family response regulator
MRISVLIADDYPLVREGLARAVSRDPALVVVGEATNGDEALARARELRPDVILLDLFMPGLGGILVLEHLRAEGSSARTLVVSASERQDTLLEALGAGAAGYLTKRATGEEVRQAVITVYGGGLAITPSMAGHLLAQFSQRPGNGGSSSAPPITAAERQLLRLIAQGRTDKEIGAEMFISARTVQNHLARIREKTGLRSRCELAWWAGEHARA